MAIGMILARAALASTLNNNGSSLTSDDDERRDTVRLVLPIDDSGRARSQSVVARAEEETKSGGDSSSSTQMAGWIQEMLSNSTSTDDTNGSSSNSCLSGLKVHTISSSQNTTNNRDSNDNTTEDGPPNMKRARSPTTEALSNLSVEQKKLVTLAKSVANFLLAEEEEEVAKDEEDGDEKMEAAASIDANSTTPSVTNGSATNIRCPLDNFTSPGGVMYLVMSLVESRGIDRIKNDFDDPNTTITAQFGHSSQELMNLLLTGQVSIYYMCVFGFCAHLVSSLQYMNVLTYILTPDMPFPFSIIKSTKRLHRTSLIIACQYQKTYNVTVYKIVQRLVIYQYWNHYDTVKLEDTTSLHYFPFG